MPQVEHDDTLNPPGGANRNEPLKPRRRWGRWLLFLVFGFVVIDHVFTPVEFTPPLCGPELYRRIEGEVREAYRASLIRILDLWGERYWQLEDRSVLRVGFPLFDGFWHDYEQMQWRAADRISQDTTIDGIEYPTPSYLGDVRRELAENHPPDAPFLQGKSISRNCEMMAAVVLTPESYARYRAEQGLPPLVSLPPVPEDDPE
ncbi:MAG: hypothetical protein ACREJ5_31420 [Geminicoccaceae bacterium]